MKTIVQFFLLSLTIVLFTACSPVKKQITNQYKLTEFSSKRYRKAPTNTSILVSMPSATSGYQTEQMLYTKKPYELSPFAHNAWFAQPANMLFPLIFQSLQHSNYFKAVASSPYSEKTHYRLDTQLIEFQQNFLKKPSVIQMSVKIVLSDVNANKVLGSRIFRQELRCQQNSPLGGVEASNQTVRQLTAKITEYVISLISKTQQHYK